MAKEAIKSESIKSAITSAEAQRQQEADGADTEKFKEVIELSKKKITEAQIGGKQAEMRSTQAGINEQQGILNNPPKIQKKSGKKMKMVVDQQAVDAAQRKKAQLQKQLAVQQAQVQELKDKAKNHQVSADEHSQTSKTKDSIANQLESQMKTDKAKLDDLANSLYNETSKENESSKEQSSDNVAKVDAPKESGATEKSESTATKEKKDKVSSENQRF